MPNQNHLKNESSPYLLQHAGNPVDWYPWGDEALQRAKREDKLMVISIGYAACHWCHVMEKESFEDTQVAELMNRFYVSIKVDREERPDIDQIYMTAAQLISGRGGWPLNVITLPDGRPIYAGTYFPKNNWLDVLIKVSQYYRAQRKEALEIAANITDGIQRSELVDLTNEKSDFKTDDLIKSFHNWKQTIDFEWGGSDHAPKFPMPAALNFLLIYAKKSEDKDASTAIKLTLDKMAIGGIYDQIGGGFARYSVDRFWIVPHFEKMLYDNGQLLSVYADAYRYSQSELYRLVLEETIAFANRELRSKDQLYFSSLDADSEGEEGKFYVWRQSELDLTLGDDSQLVSSYYSCTVHGNWENAVNILYRKQSDEQFIELNGLDANRFKQTIESAKQKLLNERDKRIRPGLDDKILTAWNAMMIRGLCDAYRATGDRDYLDSAERTMSALLKFQWRTDGGLNRNFKNGKSSINGFLDDYAFLIDSLIALYQLTFNPDYLEKSGRLINYTIEHFFDKDRMMFYY
ncbi:MAG: thioredoxin domain-containing protein, partial [Calditrichaeota bacterium]|nr:thioredoxin domain-containing protein [Calditrichota bacterium]